MLKRTLVIALLLLAGGLAAEAQVVLNSNPSATPPAPVLGGGWAFDQVNAPNVNSVDSPYIINAAGPEMLSVVDAFVAGDNYKVYDNNVLIMTTVISGGPGIWTGDPNVAWADGGFSKGSVVLPAGLNSITIQSAIETGVAPAGFFTELTAVPEARTTITGALLLLPFGMSALRILRKRQAA